MEAGDWREASDPSGKKYYYHTVSGETSWTDPRKLGTTTPPSYVMQEPAGTPGATADEEVDEFSDVRGMLKEGIISQAEFDQLCSEMIAEKKANKAKSTALENDLNRVMRESERGRSSESRQQAQGYEKQLMTALEQCSQAEAHVAELEEENQKLRAQNASLVKRLERLTQDNTLVKHENEAMQSTQCHEAQHIQLSYCIDSLSPFLDLRGEHHHPDQGESRPQRETVCRPIWWYRRRIWSYRRRN